MGGEVCKRKGFERGPWYEIQSVKEVIIAKEVKGEDASFERDLLKSWAKYESYKSAKEALTSCGSALPALISDRGLPLLKGDIDAIYHQDISSL